MLIYIILTNVSKKWKGSLCNREKQIVLEDLAESKPLGEDQHVCSLLEFQTLIGRSQYCPAKLGMCFVFDKQLSLS